MDTVKSIQIVVAWADIILTHAGYCLSIILLGILVLALFSMLRRLIHHGD